MKIINEFWAFIPARSGSKSLKNKNIKLFMKKPLLAHSILFFLGFAELTYFAIIVIVVVVVIVIY